MSLFGYLVILISTDFYDFFDLLLTFNFLGLFLVNVSIEKTYQCLTAFPNTSKFVENTATRRIFNSLLGV